MAVVSRLQSQWLPQTTRDMKAASLQMATDIQRRAVMIAPRDTGALVSSGVIEPISATAFKVVFGGGRVPYARRRHYENFKNPQTLRYLKRAGDSVKRENIKRYVK